MILNEVPNAGFPDGIQCYRFIGPFNFCLIYPFALFSPFDAASEYFGGGNRNRLASQQFIYGFSGALFGRSFGGFFHIIDSATIAKDTVFVKNKTIGRG